MNKYFDICASTPIHKDVASFINKNSSLIYGNPSSIHQYGQKSKAVLERARFNIANSINCSIDEIIFTCGGSISNNLALIGVLNEGDHFITSSYEHPAILNVLKFIKSKKIEISILKPNKAGLITPDKVQSAIKKNTKLISIMYINNEIGTINPIPEISKIAAENKILLHTDAVQAMGKINLDIKKSGVDLLSLSGHKFYAPKGVGILYVKQNTKIDPILFGGGQESGLFPGTENIVNIGAMGLAATICYKEKEKKIDYIKELDCYFIELLDKSKIDYTINGENRAPGIINLTLNKTKSPSFIINLDKEGYAISAGSACASGATTGSTTLIEIGLDSETIKKSYRISFSQFHTKKDLKGLVDCINKYIK